MDWKLLWTSSFHKSGNRWRGDPSSEQNKFENIFIHFFFDTDIIITNYFFLDQKFIILQTIIVVTFNIHAGTMQLLFSETFFLNLILLKFNRYLFSEARWNTIEKLQIQLGISTFLFTRFLTNTSIMNFMNFLKIVQYELRIMYCRCGGGRLLSTLFLE